MFTYDFMVNAFIAATIVAIMAGAVGTPLVLRGQSFAGHALSHVGFGGAAAAILLGVPPLWGMVAVTVLGGIGMGLLGTQAGERDVAIGLVLSVSMGVGLLLLSFYTAQASQATALLFGNVLGVDADMLWALAGLGVVALVSLAVIARPLLFASLQPELAAARGVKVRLVSVLFLALVALAVAACVQVVGVLLVFALMVAPAATALRVCGRVLPATALAIGLALAQSWAGLTLAYVTDWPASFWIASLGALAYGLASLRGANGT